MHSLLTLRVHLHGVCFSQAFMPFQDLQEKQATFSTSVICLKQHKPYQILNNLGFFGILQKLEVSIIILENSFFFMDF